MEKLKKGIFSKFGLFDFTVNEILTFITKQWNVVTKRNKLQKTQSYLQQHCVKNLISVFLRPMTDFLISGHILLL